MGKGGRASHPCTNSYCIKCVAWQNLLKDSGIVIVGQSKIIYKEVIAKLKKSVTPAEAGVQKFMKRLDSKLPWE